MGWPINLDNIKTADSRADLTSINFWSALIISASNMSAEFWDAVPNCIPALIFVSDYLVHFEDYLPMLYFYPLAE